MRFSAVIIYKKRCTEESMKDIHSHLLPGVDDGAQSLDDALVMAAMAAENGTDSIVLTPHCNIPGSPPNYPSLELYKLYDGLLHSVRRMNIPVKLYLGAEIYWTDDVPDLMDSHSLLSIAGSRYMLFEFPFEERTDNISRSLARIAAKGIVPVIAHPERYSAVQNYPEILASWFSMGYVIQLNKDSITGRLGS